MKSFKLKLISRLTLIVPIINIGCGDDFGDAPECIKDEIITFKKEACEEISWV